MSEPIGHAVGDVLYVILPKKMTVIPVCVVESTLRTTVEGSSLSYTVEDVRGKKMELKDEWQVFATPDDVRKSMYDRAQRQIDDIVLKAVSMAEKWDAVAGNDSHPEQISVDHDAVGIVELPDGRTARLKMGDGSERHT